MNKSQRKNEIYCPEINFHAKKGKRIFFICFMGYSNVNGWMENSASSPFLDKPNRKKAFKERKKGKFSSFLFLLCQVCKNRKTKKK